LMSGKGKKAVKGKKKVLTPKQRLFVAEYLKDLNATQAAIRSGYPKKTANRVGPENLSKPVIQAALSQARNSIEKREEAALLSAYETERELDRVIKFNLKEFVDEEGNPKDLHLLTDEQAACIKELSLIETPLGLHRNLKFYDKLGAIKTKLQRLGLLKGEGDGGDTNITINILQFNEKDLS
jgi:phage terminase small subunit